ncbi:hypothetical protein [Butyrivibrio sp. FC2001]|uniref:hypothetical protein n=1 Tax=Butyrivibrio sp. FC2001 TaxID=1280671 RepID=UPI0012DC41E7|nr:hypothetical protein [Butyrivibrio sp. FC2001]
MKTEAQLTYRNRVIFTAPSAEKIFDGTPLTEQIDVTAQGLPEGFTYKAVAEGSVTYPEDNSENNNIVTDYAIFDPSGLNVTEKFVNVELRPGTLKISEKEEVLGAKRGKDGKEIVEQVVIEEKDESNVGKTVQIDDEKTAKSDKIKKNDTSVELILYSVLVLIMLAVFVIFMMDSNKMREK